MPWGIAALGQYRKSVSLESIPGRQNAKGAAVARTTSRQASKQSSYSAAPGETELAVEHQESRLIAPDQDIVHTGDVILLAVRKADGFKCLLSGDGIVVEDVEVFAFKEGDAGIVPDVRECLFRIVQQLCYTALKELVRHTPGKDGEAAGGADRAALLEKVRQESSQNEARIAMRNPVRYGDVVQLQHVKSGKYLTVLPKQTAPQERDARRVALQQGGAHSAFVVQPYYKYKAVGEPLLYNEQVIISSQKLGPRWLLHASLQETEKRFSSRRQRYEVNCSTDATGCFFPMLFSRSADHLQYSHVVRVSYPQCDRVLGASCALGEPKRPFFRRREGELWAKGVWLLETPELLRGGDVRWGSQNGGRVEADAVVCLRHVGTGLYLSVDLDSQPEWHKGQQRVCCGRLVPEPNACCQFTLDILEDGTPGEPVDLGGRGLCKALLRFDDAYGSLWLSCEPTRTKKPTDQRPRPSLELFFGETRRIRDAAIIESLSITRPNFVASITSVMGWKASFLSASRSLKALGDVQETPFGKITQRRASITKQEFNEDLTREIFHEIHEALISSVRFVTAPQSEASPSEHAEDPLKSPSRKSRPDAQRVVRELKLVDASIDLMDALQEAGFQVTEVTARTMVRLESLEEPGSTTPATASKPGKVGPKELRCLKLLVELWRCCFQDNRRSENYFFRQGWLEKINDLNGLGLGAASCLATLVSNNKLLLQGVKVATLQKFVDFIRDLGPDETWLRFMEAVCSVEGQAIANKQQQVLQMMYYPGAFASQEERDKWGGNRRNLFLGVKLSAEAKRPFPVNHLGMSRDGPFPGVSIATFGIRDLLVSWTTNTTPWTVGCGWLYFHPQHLGLTVKETESTPVGSRIWVSLADVAWVLNPDYVYAAVHPSKPDEWQRDKVAMRQQGVFKAKEVLARYLVSQIDLMKQMCMDNQVNSIRTLQDEYSFDLMCCALWDSSLAPAVRCSFCGLLNNLWVNRHPHLAAQLVPVVHNWQDLAAVTPGTLWLPAFELDPGWLDTNQNSEFDRHPSASKFNVLVEYIRHHLVSMDGRMVHSHSGPVAYTAEVTRLLLDLLRYGFVAAEDQLVKLLEPMLACLDGRTDWLECEPLNREDQTKSSSGASTPRGSQPPTAPSTARSPGNDSFEEGAEASVPLLCAGASSCAERPIKEQQRQKGEASGGMPLYFSIPDSSDALERYRSSDSCSELVEAKVLMCEVCAAVMEIAVGNGVAQLARLFAEQSSAARGSTELKAGEEEATRALDCLRPWQLDFDLLSGTSFNTLLLDLMMYESPKLFVAAAKVMRLWNHRVADTFERASELIILGDAAEGEMYKQMKRHVARLSDLVNTTEDWGVDSALGAINMSKFEDAKRLLEQIRYLCSEGDKNSDGEVPDTRMQSLLSSLRLGEELIQAFDTPYEDFQGDTKGVLTKFMQLVCKLLHQFVMGHARNQQFFHKNLSKIAEWNGRGIDTAYAISSIFRENRPLCERVSESIVYEVGQVLVNERETKNHFLPQRIDFLRSIVVAGQRPIVRNKEIVLNMLKNPFYAKVLHLFEGQEGFKRRGELLRKFSSWKELEKPEITREWKGDDSELQYHHSCLNLLSTLCVGRDESGASAFVQAKCPARHLVRNYLETGNTQVDPGSSEDCQNMCVALKRTMLALVITVYYDTDLKDEVFFASETHLILLENVVNELQKLKWDLGAVGLTAIRERLLLQILHFFNALVEFTPRSTWHQDIEPLLNERLLPLVKELALPFYKVRKNEQYFKAVVSRTLGFLTQDRESMQQRLVNYSEAHAKDRSNQLSEACRAYVAQLQEHPLVQSAIEQEHATLIGDVCNLYAKSNPEDPAYQKERDAAVAQRRPVQGGFRRNGIATTAFVQRAISHCLQGNHLRDWSTTSFVIVTVCDVLESLASDHEELKRMQLICAQGGGERLVIDTLCARPDSELVRQSLNLAEHLLKPNNKAVQEIFVHYFHGVDDSELWHLFREMIEAVSMNVKSVRTLKRIVRESGRKAQDVLTAEEFQMLHMFSDNVRTLEHVLQFLQLLCEGHNSPVQRYIFQQRDNSSSINLLEKIKGLCLKICKNEAAADQCDFEDIDILTTCFELLVEATTRPDPRNQLFLSTSGIVEGVLKMLNARFVLLRRENREDAGDPPGDCYPTPVRSLKAQVTLLLLVLLELRPDAEVHQTLVIRTDATLLRRRLVFIHRWFLASQLKQGEEQLPHICKPEDGSCLLDDLTQDDGIIVPHKPSAALLEDYVEEDLINFFSEAFNIMIMMHQLRPHDAKFRRELKPSVPDFDESSQLRLSAEAFAQAKAAYDAACKYSAAYYFFNDWIRMVEVNVDHRVFDLYFRMPVLCHFILGSEKVAIMNEVPVEPPEAKVKDFITRCSRLYEMTQHTRSLSKWAPKALHGLRFLTKGKPPRPLLFFMKNDSRNLTRTTYLCMAIAIFLNALLFFGLALPESASEKHVLPEISDLKMRDGTWCAGVLYLGLTILQFLVVCLTYMPIDYGKIYKDSLHAAPRLQETVAALAVAVLLFVALRFACGQSTPSGVAAIFALLIAGGAWQAEYMHCPRNEVARLVATAYAGIKRQQILRRLFLMIMAIGAVSLVEFCYTFLLLDVLFIFAKLQNIIKAVTIPIDSLALTLLVGVIVMYIYAVIAFYYFREDYGEGCFNMVDCTVSTIYLGMREDIGQNINAVKAAGPEDGVEEYHHWYGRVVFDLSFFILITTVLMNILFGIIVDTFGALRDEAQQRESHKKNTTFIASLERSEIDRAARAEGIMSGFDYLELERQNCWNYMNFVFYLRRKDPIQFTGPETLISKFIREEDISWVPIYNCALLQRQQARETAAEVGDGGAT